MNLQEAFNRAFIGLRNQNWEPSIDENGSCVYNGKDGKRCAYGHVDPQGTVGYEGNLADSPGWKNMGLYYEQMVELQAAHDYAATAGSTPFGTAKYNYLYLDMEGNLRKFAAYHNLTIPE